MPPIPHPTHLLAFLAASVCGTVLLVSSLTLLVAWWRPSYPGWRGWAAGHTLLVLGMLIGTYRPPELVTLSVLLGNALVIVGAALFVEAFHRFAGQGGAQGLRRVYRGSVPLVIAALFLLTVVSDQIMARTLLVNAFVALTTVSFVGLILSQMRRQPELRAGYRLNLGLLLLVVTLTLPRLFTFRPGVQAAEVFAFTLPNILMFVAVLLLSVGGTFTFWLLHDDRRRVEMRRLHDELNTLAHTDALTSTLNRRGMEQAFTRWAARAQPGAGRLLVLDIDEFKTINDRFGHTAGDDHLVSLSRLLEQVAHPGDLVGRTGGDEFTMLLTGAPTQISQQLEQLTAALSERTGRLGFGVSFGWTRVGPADLLAAALARADAAMYHNKAQGRGSAGD
ncbi:GGDEF domain-containing protein [Deinococcus ficus]|uniref:GGDEF domain-containing protein n=1 Tax=Deinococcus ficus TaxID=317577 RepID=UPI0003B60B86|nr:GGDEF domain-containing protein [Deinococcus ficus]